MGAPGAWPLTKCSEGVTVNNVIYHGTPNLSWNTHVNDVIKKAAKRLYFLVQLNRAKVPCNDLGLFYITCVKSVLDYAIPLYYHSHPKYLVNELERVQKRALKIMCPSLSYDEALTHMEIAPFSVHHSNICATFFNEILSDSHPKYLVNELERVQKRALKIMCPSLSYDEALTHMEIAPFSVHHSNICATFFNEILSDSDHRLRALLPPSHQACKYSLPRTSKFDVPKINTKRARNSFIIRSTFNRNTV